MLCDGVGRDGTGRDGRAVFVSRILYMAYIPSLSVAIGSECVYS